MNLSLLFVIRKKIDIIVNLPRILYNRGYNALGVLVATACQFARLSGWRKDIFLTPGPVAFTPWKSSLFYVKNIVVRAHGFVLQVSPDVYTGLLFICTSVSLCFVCGQGQRRKELRC